MPEKLVFGSQPQPEQSNTPDMMFINKLAELEAKKNEIEEKIKASDEAEKQFLLLNLEEINKKIENYHQSFGKYRRGQKINRLKEDAGEETVTEALGFKAGQAQPESEVTGIGENFLKDLENFKKSKKPE